MKQNCVQPPSVSAHMFCAPHKALRIPTAHDFRVIIMISARSRARAHKQQTFVLLTCLLPCLVAKGSRVLEKKLNKTKTVFSHLLLVRTCSAHHAKHCAFLLCTIFASLY